jgi:cysteine desulfurase/selenocysteine lyase
VAVATHQKLDAERLRADFAVFDELVNGKPVAYLDSAASTQKPRQVLDVMRDFYEHSYANVHRGVYRLAERATAGYETARQKVATYVNAPSEREVIFTRSATEALNLVAYAWGLDNLGEGDVVVVTDLEHHSSFVPWQYVAGKTGAAFRVIPIDEGGELRLDALDEIGRDARYRQSRTGPRELGTRARCHHGRGRGAGGSSSFPRRPSARLRVSRAFLAQDVRPERHRRSLGQA